MVTEFIYLGMAQSMRENGRTIKKKGKERSRMERSTGMRVCGKRETTMEKAFNNGAKEQNGMETDTKVSFWMGIERGGADMNTVTGTCTKANGRMETRMRMVHIILRTGTYLRENGRMD